MSQALDRALAEQRFVPYFQPLIRANDQTIASLEVLARWIRPDGKELGPEHFMRAAELTNHMVEIDHQVSSTALEWRRSWHNELGRWIPLSLNISSHRLSDAKMISQLRHLGTHAAQISLELLETTFLDDPKPHVANTLQMVRDMGVSIEIDDFGTGRTSILALTQLRPNRLKLDRRLVAPAVASKRSRDLVESIVRIARNLDISVTAEGVESAAAATLMAELGCERLQGFYFARPMPAEGVPAFLRQWKGHII